MVLSASLPLLTHIDLWRLLDTWHKMEKNAYISSWVGKFNMRKQSQKGLSAAVQSHSKMALTDNIRAKPPEFQVAHLAIYSMEGGMA